MKESFVEEDKKEEKMNAKDINNLEESSKSAKDEEKPEMKVDNVKDENKKEKIKKENNNNPKSKKKYLILGIIIGIFLVVGILLSTIFALVNINNEKIINGVSISGVDVSGLSKEEAKGTIESLYHVKKEK